MDEDPSNEAYVLSLLEGYGSHEAEAMDIEPAPAQEDWREKYIAWIARGELPADRAAARRIARMAKSFAIVDGEQAVTFFTDIVYRFGVPNSIITDNGFQFTGKKFLEFCDKFHIRVDWAAVAHPQTNGQVERANGMILQGLKPRIFDQHNKSGRK
jgi:transposase InsO family protein